MANSTSGNAALSPLCIPTPRSPPKYPDMCGRHRKQAELPVLNREIGFLEEELQSLDTLHPASKCCKEIDEFVGKNPDPLIPLNLKVHRSSRFWKWLWYLNCLSSFLRIGWSLTLYVVSWEIQELILASSKSSCNFSWLCFCCGCSLCPMTKCNCNSLKNYQCCCPHYCCCSHCYCLEKSSFGPCCHLPKLSWSECCSWSCDWTHLTCEKVGKFCPTCKEKPCCLTCCLCC